jgi:hypothetical protein
MAGLVVTRLLQNPLGQVAPEGQRGDIVRVSDGVSKAYLDPEEFERLDEATLRVMLADLVAPRKPRPASTPDWAPASRGAAESGQSNAAAPAKAPRASRPPMPAAATEGPYSATAPRRAKRRAQPLW